MEKIEVEYAKSVWFSCSHIGRYFWSTIQKNYPKSKILITKDNITLCVEIGQVELVHKIHH